MSLQGTVESYIGISSDTTALKAWLEAGSEDVARKLGERYFDQISESAAVTVDGYTVNGLIKHVHKANQPTINIPIDQKALASDPKSMWFATEDSPVHYYSNGKVYILPGGGDIELIKFPTVSVTGTTLGKYNSHMIQATVLYGSIQAAIKAFSDSLRSISTSAIGIPVFIGTPDFALTDDDKIALSTIYFDGVNGVTPLTLDHTLVDSNVPTYTVDDTTISYTGMDASLSQDDAEMVQAFSSKAGLELNEFQKSQYERLNNFNKDNVVYQAKIQKAIEELRVQQQKLAAVYDQEFKKDLTEKQFNAAKSYEAKVTEYRTKLEQFQSNVQIYSAQIQEEAGLRAASIQTAQAMLQLIPSLRNEYNLTTSR
ncbi:MAG: hypothetical protein KKA84_12090 [Bacteroidetes bacterium]|nr:hypothetical protein [Bacteroidota bacterium]